MPDPPAGHKGTPDHRTRGQRLEASNRQPDLPEVSLPYLLDYLVEIGPAGSSGNGPVPFTHTEIRDWQENTGIDLTAWEARTLRALSREFVGEVVAGANPKRAAPYRSENVDTAAVASDLKSHIAGLGRL